MVAILDDGVAMHLQHLIAAHQRSQDDALRYFDMLKRYADDARATGRAVGHHLQCLAGTVSQGIDLGNVATPDVAQQGADGGLLR